jgi:hypothetical protein
MKPLEIDQIEAFLKSTYSSKGVLPDYATFPNRDKEVNFLSKALAAFAIQVHAKVSPDVAAASITDGDKDNGIDAFYFHEATHVLWLVQSKFIQDGSGQPDLKDVALFPVGVRMLLAGELDRFNKFFTDRRAELDKALSDADLRVKLVLVDTGTDFADDRVTLFEDLKLELNKVDGVEYLSFDHFNLALVHEEITETFARKPINETLTIRQWGMVTTPYKSCYGQIPASRLAELYAANDDKLVERNIRKFRGLTVVNERIAETIANTPEDFFYLNNGVTAICRRLDIVPVSRNNRDAGQFVIEDLSIVNGAQTVGTIASQLSKAKPAKDPLVFIKIVSLEQGQEGFGDRVTRSTNFQNRVERVDFVALDPEQERLRRTMLLSSINYHYKKDDESIERDGQNFFVEEATVALACLGNIDNLVPLKREPGEFWDLEDGASSRYRVLFNSGLSARTAWRTVQIARHVFQVLSDRHKTEANRSRSKCYKHSRFMALHIVFIQSGLAHKPDVNLTPAEITKLSEVTDLVVETVCDEAIAMFPYKEFYNVFKNVTDCKGLKNRVMAALAAKDAARAAVASAAPAPAPAPPVPAAQIAPPHPQPVPAPAPAVSAPASAPPAPPIPTNPSSSEAPPSATSAS